MSTEASSPAGSDGAKSAEATRVLTELLAHMGISAALEAKDAEDGSLSIRVIIEGDGAGLAPGKRTPLLESIQFLINKIVNKTPQSRRWINLGIGEHPAPRAAQQPRAPAAVAAKPPPKVPPARGPQQQRQAQKPAQGSAQRASADEAEAAVEEDAALTAAVQELAEKSAKHGRFVAVLGMNQGDRARTMKAVKDVAGVTVRQEGEGRNRRLALHPDKPAPMPKSLLPDYDDEEEEDDPE